MLPKRLNRGPKGFGPYDQELGLLWNMERACPLHEVIGTPGMVLAARCTATRRGPDSALEEPLAICTPRPAVLVMPSIVLEDCTAKVNGVNGTCRSVMSTARSASGTSTT
jgi:hypothetical protein